MKVEKGEEGGSYGGVSPRFFSRTCKGADTVKRLQEKTNGQRENLNTQRGRKE